MNAARPIRILCIDDHPIVREGLAGIIALQPDMELTGAAASGMEAVKLFQETAPDIVLVDLRLHDMSGHEVIERLLAIQPAARIIVLTSFEGDVDIKRALEAGARGYVVKGIVREELLGAIRAVHAGRRHIPAPIAEKLAEHLTAESLTPRELKVLAHMAKGERNKEIGAALSIAEDTVKMHVRNILAKLGVSDRTEAVTLAIRRGILHL